MSVENYLEELAAEIVLIEKSWTVIGEDGNPETANGSDIVRAQADRHRLICEHYTRIASLEAYSEIVVGD